MEPTFTKSFIPKKTLTATPKKRRKPTNLLTLFSLIVFFTVVLTAVGVFLYGEFLRSSIDRKQDSLDRSRGAFEPALINELARLDERIVASEQILSQHVALSQLFDFLETNTLATVRFGEFALTAISPDQYNLVMQGQATSFDAVALQSDIFGESELLVGPIFSDLDLDAFGNVQFNVNAIVNGFEISYSGRGTSNVIPDSEVENTLDN